MPPPPAAAEKSGAPPMPPPPRTDLANQNQINKNTINGNKLEIGKLELLTQFNTPTLPSGSYKFKLYYTSYPHSDGIVNVVLDPNNEPKSYLEITKVNQAGDGLVMNIAKNMPYGTNGIKLIDFITSKSIGFLFVVSSICRASFRF